MLAGENVPDRIARIDPLRRRYLDQSRGQIPTSTLNELERRGDESPRRDLRDQFARRFFFVRGNETNEKGRAAQEGSERGIG